MATVALTRIAESVERIATTIARWVRRDANVVGSRTFPRKLQRDGWSCGSRSTQAIALHFDRDVRHREVMERVGTTKDGTATTPIVRYLRKLGLRAGYHRRMSFRQLVQALARGAVVLVDLEGIHWGVVHAASDDHVWLADPSIEQLGRRITKARFRSRWTGLGVIVSKRVGRRRRRRA
ncbi:MAG TPA: cysteine peptidase family C39 domain-containing protein [Kofleriaceae bacterium]|nr:cysteine peptidase family C39 domain-containing protein [Kofleriaceae bacterium]